MKIQSPWMGRIKGSAGQMTGCKVYDKNVLRAKAFEVSNPNTPAQQTQRKFFADLTALCSDFSDELLRTLFPQKPKTMSRRNAITKQIAMSNTMSGGAKVIDYADIDTLGNASVMDFGETLVNIASNSLGAVLDDSVAENPTLANYYAFFAFVNSTKKEIVIPAVFEEVENNNYSTSLPTGWTNQDTIHAIPFITDAKAAPTGFGTMSVTKRPAHTEA